MSSVVATAASNSRMRSLKESPGIGWMGWGSMDSMEAEVGREDMGRLLCWSVNGPYLLYLAATPFFFNGREGGLPGSHRLD